MYVSDMIVTKPGGLTISEILNMELIPVFIYPIPGQETGNVSVLKKYGVGLSPRNIKEIRNIVLDLKLCPDKLESIKGKIRNIQKKDCLGELFNVICQNSSGPAC
ncbi:MAG: hypothetical protein A3K83_00470 [Omnitrophica WOR_2 bacterium RBG_13_44_8b]|nr:MAG: hypothetical protein A3K83_00470 [Omnitrophica WOR_2 bacterium RBG_13_44_8b]